MNSRRMSIALSALLLFGCVVAALWVIPGRPRIPQIPADTESSFLKSYAPQRVIERFDGNWGQSSTGPAYSSADSQAGSHNFNFEWNFALRSASWMPLMDALRDDVAGMLHVNHAQILSQGGDERRGFQFEYKLGKNMGTVTISPLEITPSSRVRRATPLPEGFIEATVKVDVAEQWFPQEPGVMGAKLIISSH